MFRFFPVAVFCGVTTMAVVPAAHAAAAAADPAVSSGSAGMARVSAGEFMPPFRDDSTGIVRVRVKAFRLDKRAVTTAQFLKFVEANPRYARSRIPRLLADSGYLRSWDGDRQPGPALNVPVTNVSWHAAKQYCAEQGKRLPTTAEWELAAARLPSGTDSATQERAILEWYARSATETPPVSGSGTRHAHGILDLHSVIWEWTADFNAWNGGGVNGRGVKGGGLSCGGGAARAASNTSYATYMRWAFRGSLRPDYTVGTLGFRCARNETPNKE